MVRTVAVTLSLLVAATSLTGCGSNQDGAVGRGSGKIAGISAGYRGVHLRDPALRVSARLGTSVTPSTGDGLAEGRFPSFVPADTEPTRYYRDAAFVFLDRRVSAIVVYGIGAKSDRGVGLGNPLSDAKSAYHAACSPAGGSDITHPARCDAKVGAGTYIEFSGNPIISVTLSIEPFLSDNGAGCGGLDNPFAKGADRVISRCQQEARTGKPAT